jgi:hypothetical protein
MVEVLEQIKHEQEKSAARYSNCKPSGPTVASAPAAVSAHLISRAKNIRMLRKSLLINR